jgi:hypothetical protein
MSGMKIAVELVVEDQRTHAPALTAPAALEHVLSTVKLHHIHTHDPLSRAYAAVLRHPKQARFDAKEIDRHEQRNAAHGH